jgi:undecaprenyl-diphosphatase
MEVIGKIILGIIQGITELLPISSSAHLLLISQIFNIKMDLTFLTFLHFSSGLAIFFGFWEEIKSVFISKKRKNIIRSLIIGIIPAGIIGLFFYNNIQILHEQNLLITINLIVIGIFMIFVEKVSLKKEKSKAITTENALWIGISQAIALMPGISRSGITISSGILSGIKKDVALTYSFLIGLPFLFLGFVLEVFKNPNNLENILKPENIIGGLAAFIFGYFTLRILKKLVNTKFLTFFGFYRILLGIALIFIMLFN